MNKEMRKIHYNVVAKFVTDVQTMMELQGKRKDITTSQERFINESEIERLSHGLYERCKNVSLSLQKLFIEEAESELTIKDVAVKLQNLTLSELYSELRAIP